MKYENLSKDSEIEEDGLFLNNKLLEEYIQEIEVQIINC